MKYNILRRMAVTMMTIAAGIITFSQSAVAQTQYTSDDINNAILLPGSLRPEWENPEDAPWQIFDGYKMYPTKAYVNLPFTISSDKPIIITYYNGGGNYYDIYEKSKKLSEDCSGYKMFTLPAGNHSLYLRYISTISTSFYISSLGIFPLDDNIDTANVLTSKSKPIEFVNDTLNPWYTRPAGIFTSRTTPGDTSSEIKLRFTIDKISKLSWEQKTIKYNTSSSTYNYNNLKIYDNGKYFDYKTHESGDYAWYKHTEVFLPGTHEITFVDNQWRNASYSAAYGCLQMGLRNIELSDEWFDVTTVAGDLGNSVIDEISRYGYTELNDVEMLKVKGQLNANDWQRISQMTNLKALDIEETDVTGIPSAQFKDNEMMTYINLPKGLKTISSEAFYNSNLKYLTLPEGIERINASAFYVNKIQNLEVPSSLEYIGSEAFSGTSFLKTITFTPDSKFSTIGYAAFAQSGITEIKLPESLLSYEKDNSGYCNSFWNCLNLKSIKFPSKLKTIPTQICQNCFYLTDITWPQELISIDLSAFQNTAITNFNFPKTLKNIYSKAFARSSVPNETYSLTFPESLEMINSGAFLNGNLSEVYLPLHLKTLGKDAFKGNANLKTIRLHSGAKDLPCFLDGCTSLETIILPCATPPTRTADILGSQDKKKINLIVPEFARSSYALDDYWYLFGSITAGEEATNQPYWNVTGDLILREGRRIPGNPEVEVSNGASIRVIGETPATFGNLTFNFNESSPAAFVNNCVTTSANNIEVRFSVAANQWYMFTPMFDVNLSDIKVTNTDNYVFRYYDAESRAAGSVNTTGASGNWKNVTDTELKAGQGYIFQCDKASEIIFPEQSVANSRVLSTEQSDVMLASHESGITANKNWNLIGNPYPSYYDIWYLDVEAPITVYKKDTNGKMSYQALSVTDDQYVLRPMEAFFIQKPEDAEAAVFEIEGRQTTNAIGSHQAQNAPRRKAPGAERNIFNIEIMDNEGNSLDRTRVVINESASTDYEVRYDAAKFMGSDAQLYTIDNNKNLLAINERPLGNGEVALGLRTGVSREYTIEATRADGDVWLVDLKTGAEYDLSEGNFSIYVEPNTTIEDRYALRFVPAANSVKNSETAKTKIEGGKGYIAIENPNSENITVFTLGGAKILDSDNMTIREEVAAGIYLVKTAEKTCKVIVK